GVVPWDLSNTFHSHNPRYFNLIPVPQLSLVVAANNNGTVLLLTLTRPRGEDPSFDGDEYAGGLESYADDTPGRLTATAKMRLLWPPSPNSGDEQEEGAAPPQ